MDIDNQQKFTQSMQAHRLKAKQRQTGVVEELDLGTTDIIMESLSAVYNGLSSSATMMEIIRPNPVDLALSSDPETDHQLLFSIRFRERVDIRKISFRSTVYSGDGSGPRLIHLFTNRENIDFGDVCGGDIDPAQELEINEEHLINGHKFSLLGADFRNVDSIQIFFAENHGDIEVTFLNRVGLFGSIASAYANSNTSY